MTVLIQLYILIQLVLVLQMSSACSSSLKCLVIKLNLTSSQFSTRMKTPTLCSILKLHYCWQRSALFLSQDFSFTEVHLRFSFGPFIRSTTIRDHNSAGFLGPRQPAHEQLCKTSSISLQVYEHRRIKPRENNTCILNKNGTPPGRLKASDHMTHNRTSVRGLQMNSGISCIAIVS